MKGGNGTGPQDNEMPQGGFWAAVRKSVESGVMSALNSTISFIKKLEEYQDTIDPEFKRPEGYTHVRLRKQLNDAHKKTIEEEKPLNAVMEPLTSPVDVHQKTAMPKEDEETSPRSPRENNLPVYSDPITSVIKTLDSSHFRCMNNAMFSEGGGLKFDHYLKKNTDFRTTVTDFSSGLENILKKGDGQLVPEYAAAMYEFTIKRQDIPELTGRPNDMQRIRSLLEKNPDVAQYLVDNLPRLEIGAKGFETFYKQTLTTEKKLGNENMASLYETSHVERLQQRPNKNEDKSILR